ncbi:MAG: hypothetical protein ABIT08_17490 [Bacteroidia bacterium]
MRKYSYSVSVLYQLLRILNSNCRNNIAAFSAFKNKYTPAMLDLLLSELAAAEKLKGEQARSLEHETLRIEMIPLADRCLTFWQYLKRYIADYAGPSHELQVANWDAAGWEFYTESASFNWDKLRNMCSMALTYIEDHEADLKTKGYMPDAFKDNFDDACNGPDGFNKKYDAFLLAQENAFQGTVDKVAANNNIFMKFSDLCADGQTIFAKDETRKALFSMEAVASLIKPTGTSIVVVELTNSETNAPVPGFDLVNVETERTVTANAEGRAEMGQQAEGSNSYRIVADGYEEKTITITVAAGTKTIQKFSLKPLVSEAAKAEIAGSAALAPESVTAS